MNAAIRMTVLVAAFTWGLLLAACLGGACTEVTKTVLAQQHPDDIGGTYTATWSSESGGALLGTAKVDAFDLSISFAPYPCFLVLGQEVLGGGFDYVQSTGRFTADAKSLGGDLVLTVEGHFSGPAIDFAGVYRAQFNGVLCDRGTLTMQGEE